MNDFTNTATTMINNAIATGESWITTNFETIMTVCGFIIAIALFIMFITGAIKTFKRNWIAALLLLIFVGPLWFCWAIIEAFRGPVQKPVAIAVQVQE